MLSCIVAQMIASHAMTLHYYYWKGVVVGICTLWSAAGLAKTKREKWMPRKFDRKTDI